MAKDNDDPGWLSDMAGLVCEIASELNEAGRWAPTWVGRAAREEYGVDWNGHPKE